MEPNKNNKAANIISLVGILIFFIVLILIAVFAFKRKNNVNEPDYYAPIASSVTPTETPGIDSDTQQEISDISLLLNSLTSDIATVIQCNNPTTVTLTTPGVKASMIVPLRNTFEKANVDLWQAYKADIENSTSIVKGDYLIVMDMRTVTDTCKLYVYVWTDYLNSSYVISSIDYQIGDF